MDAAEARRRAVARVQVMLGKGRSRADIAGTVYEGAMGYLLSGGRMTIPGQCRHDTPGAHTFKVTDLLAEIDSPQGGLFA